MIIIILKTRGKIGVFSQITVIKFPTDETRFTKK